MANYMCLTTTPPNTSETDENCVSRDKGKSQSSTKNEKQE